jgi:hypothetical protein
LGGRQTYAHRGADALFDTKRQNVWKGDAEELLALLNQASLE